MKTILALVDLDSTSTEIMDTAFRFAEEYNAKLIIYHHLFREESISINPTGFTINSDLSISKYGRMYEKAYAVKPEYRFHAGKFKKGVYDCLEKDKVDLVIMGSNGVSNTKERILGSHAEIVLKNAKCSVLILKDIRLNHTLNEVVFASSFNEVDKEIFQYFLKFIKVPNDTLIHLLMVDTYSFFNQPTVLVKESMADFEKLARPYRTKSHFFHGTSVEDGIVKFMAKVKPDLLIMSNKYSRLLRSALSSSKMVSTLHQNDHPFLNIDYDKTKQEV